METVRQARRWATYRGAGEYADMSDRTIRRLVASGKLPGYSVPGGRGVRVDLNELDALLVHD